MATYDFTKGEGVAISNLDVGKHFVARIPFVVEDIIASSVTLTANAKITAADIIQIWNIPAKVVFTGQAILETVVAGTAGSTLDIGLNGGQEFFAGITGVATAGTQTISAVNVGWGPATVAGKVFTTTDTLDVQFIANETVGSYILHVAGFMIW